MHACTRVGSLGHQLAVLRRAALQPARRRALGPAVHAEGHDERAAGRQHARGLGKHPLLRSEGAGAHSVWAYVRKGGRLL